MPCHSLSSSQRLQLPRDPALVAGGSVLLDDAPLCRAVNQRKRLGHGRTGALGVLLLQQPPHRAHLMPETRLTKPVNLSAPLLRAHTFQGRYSIGHSLTGILRRDVSPNDNAIGPRFQLRSGSNLSRSPSRLSFSPLIFNQIQP